MNIMGISDIISRKFVDRVVTSAVTMVAANYTATGIQKGIDFAVRKLQGESSEDTSSTDKDDQTVDNRPLFVREN